MTSVISLLDENPVAVTLASAHLRSLGPRIEFKEWLSTDMVRFCDKFMFFKKASALVEDCQIEDV